MTSRGGGEGIKDFFVNSKLALLIKSVKMGREGGVKNYQKLRDVIFRRTLFLN